MARRRPRSRSDLRHQDQVERCPTRKVGHPNKTAALGAAALTRFPYVRIYRCPFCRLWHLTTHPPREVPPTE